MGAILNRVRTVNSLGVRVTDTDNKQYLGVYSPDITVYIGELHDADSYSVYMVIELKHTNVSLEGKGLGQAYDYSLAICAAHSHRRYHVVMPSDFVDKQFMLLDFNDNSTLHYISASLAHAISSINNRVLQSPDFNGG